MDKKQRFLAGRKEPKWYKSIRYRQQPRRPHFFGSNYYKRNLFEFYYQENATKPISKTYFVRLRKVEYNRKKLEDLLQFI